MIRKIDNRWIKRYQPCICAVEWCKENCTSKKPLDVLHTLIKYKEYSWANWLIVRLMTHPQQIRYAIYAAEKVIKIFEEEYPDDNRPREAIRAAKRYLKNPTKKNANAADAADAADAAYAAAYAADAADAADEKMLKQILNYGIKRILGESWTY